MWRWAGNADWEKMAEAEGEVLTTSEAEGERQTQVAIATGECKLVLQRPRFNGADVACTAHHAGGRRQQLPWATPNRRGRCN